MNTLLAVIIGALTVYLAYTLYARRIDRNVIQSDPKRATPATLYMDGVDFMPTNRNILFGYHFKSIAAAGPIIGAIVAANLWGWLPSIIWLILGVSFLGWASDYSGIVISVRNEGNSLSAIAHRLVSPRSRSILFVFIFFYLLLVAGAFVGIMATVLESQPKVQLGVIVLTVMGLQFGYLVGGSILIETIFTWPGTGFLLNKAILTRDIPMLQGAMLVLALWFVLINLVVDLLYFAVDPRLRAEGGGARVAGH